jgi:thioredoxin-like negative regulator of GroEL
MVGVLYFSAPWCGPCQTFGPTMERVASELGVDLQKVNVEEEPHRADEYGVQSIPATAWYKDGIFKRFQPGVMNEPALRELIINL